MNTSLESDNSTTKAKETSSAKKDWFGYIFSTVVGIILTVGGIWYQTYVSQRDALAAEIERARGLRQIAVGIVEEHVLNGRKIEIERLTRIIEQRRRDESITIPIPVTEIVELAEYSIENSRHLTVDRKESMKPIFDLFYEELRTRSFELSVGQLTSSPLLNEAAKQIQEGKTNEALASLKRLDEVLQRDFEQAAKRAKPSITYALLDVFSSPIKTIQVSIYTVIYLILLRIFYVKFGMRKYFFNR